MTDDGKKNNNNTVSAVSALTHVGITIASCIFVGVFIGRFLDRVLKTSPWFLIVFSLLGVASAFITIIKKHYVHPPRQNAVSDDTDHGQSAGDDE